MRNLSHFLPISPEGSEMEEVFTISKDEGSINELSIYDELEIV
jgi:hypothetical protein